MYAGCTGKLADRKVLQKGFSLSPLQICRPSDAFKEQLGTSVIAGSRPAPRLQPDSEQDHPRGGQAIQTRAQQRWMAHIFHQTVIRNLGDGSTHWGRHNRRDTVGSRWNVTPTPYNSWIAPFLASWKTFSRGGHLPETSVCSPTYSCRRCLVIFSRTRERRKSPFHQAAFSSYGNSNAASQDHRVSALKKRTSPGSVGERIFPYPPQWPGFTVSVL